MTGGQTEKDRQTDRQTDGRKGVPSSRLHYHLSIKSGAATQTIIDVSCTPPLVVVVVVVVVVIVVVITVVIVIVVVKRMSPSIVRPAVVSGVLGVDRALKDRSLTSDYGSQWVKTV